MVKSVNGERAKTGKVVKGRKISLVAINTPKGTMDLLKAMAASSPVQEERSKSEGDEPSPIQEKVDLIYDSDFDLDKEDGNVSLESTEKAENAEEIASLSLTRKNLDYVSSAEKSAKPAGTAELDRIRTAVRAQMYYQSSGKVKSKSSGRKRLTPRRAAALAADKKFIKQVGEGQSPDNVDDDESELGSEDESSGDEEAVAKGNASDGEDFGEGSSVVDSFLDDPEPVRKDRTYIDKAEAAKNRKILAEAKRIVEENKKAKSVRSQRSESLQHSRNSSRVPSVKSKRSIYSELSHGDPQYYSKRDIREARVRMRARIARGKGTKHTMDDDSIDCTISTVTDNGFPEGDMFRRTEADKASEKLSRKKFRDGMFDRHPDGSMKNVDVEIRSFKEEKAKEEREKAWAKYERETYGKPSHVKSVEENSAKIVQANREREHEKKRFHENKAMDLWTAISTQARSFTRNRGGLSAQYKMVTEDFKIINVSTAPEKSGHNEEAYDVMLGRFLKVHLNSMVSASCKLAPSGAVETAIIHGMNFKVQMEIVRGWLATCTEKRARFQSAHDSIFLGVKPSREAFEETIAVEVREVQRKVQLRWENGWKKWKAGHPELSRESPEYKQHKQDCKDWAVEAKEKAKVKVEESHEHLFSEEYQDWIRKEAKKAEIAHGLTLIDIQIGEAEYKQELFNYYSSICQSIVRTIRQYASAKCLTTYNQLDSETTLDSNSVSVRTPFPDQHSLVETGWEIHALYQKLEEIYYKRDHLGFMKYYRLLATTKCKTKTFNGYYEMLKASGIALTNGETSQFGRYFTLPNIVTLTAFLEAPIEFKDTKWYEDQQTLLEDYFEGIQNGAEPDPDIWNKFYRIAADQKKRDGNTSAKTEFKGTVVDPKTIPQKQIAHKSTQEWWNSAPDGAHEQYAQAMSTQGGKIGSFNATAKRDFNLAKSVKEINKPNEHTKWHAVDGLDKVWSTSVKKFGGAISREDGHWVKFKGQYGEAIHPYSATVKVCLKGKCAHNPKCYEKVCTSCGKYGHARCLQA